MNAINDNAKMPWLAKHSALSYANQWFETDREFMQGLQFQHSKEIDADLLGKLAAKYMVARGFKKEGGEAPTTDLRWLAAATHLKHSLTSTRPIHDEVHVLAEHLGTVAPRERIVGQKLISAATKFLWFSGRHSVRILDKRAVLALVRFGGKRGLGTDYGAFAAVWQEHFNTHRSEIADAIEQLPNLLEWTSIAPEFHNEARMTFKQTWFIDRVFDKYLWTIGAP